MSRGLAGVGNSPAHQYLITYFLIGIHNRFANIKKYKNYRVYPELDTNNSKNPDLSIYIRKKPTNELIAVIEFCSSKTFGDDCVKVTNLLKSFPTIKEGYVFNTETFLMYKISRGANGEPLKTKVVTDTIEAIAYRIKDAVDQARADLQPIQ